MRRLIDRGVAGRTWRGAALALALGSATLGIAACGSSTATGPAASRNPQTLLRQTFASAHDVHSGVLDFQLTMVPTGSTVIQAPVSLSLSGPFQSKGKGRTPQSAFTLAFSGLGKHGSLGVRTTDGAAYVTIEGQAYRLPASDVSELRSTLGSSSSPGLSTLGIDPMGWLRDPRIVGTQTIDGAVTEHLRAGIDVSALITSIDRVLAKDSSALHAATGGATQIPPATARRIAADVRDPTVDVYTGKADSTLRRLVVSATVPVSGSLSTRLGGLTSASFRLQFDYSQLNRPQTIAAPAHPQSYAALQAKIRTIASALESSLGETTGTGTAGTTGTASSGGVDRYSRCIDRAGGDVAKMQKCASLLQSGS